MTARQRDALLAYCRIEDPTPGDLDALEGLYSGAVAYLANAGVPQPPEGSPRWALYHRCLCYLVLDGFDQREPSATTPFHENPAFRRILNQLKLTGG